MVRDQRVTGRAWPCHPATSCSAPSSPSLLTVLTVLIAVVAPVAAIGPHVVDRHTYDVRCTIFAFKSFVNGYTGATAFNASYFSTL